MIYTLTLNPVLDRTLTVAALQLNEVLRVIDVHLDCGGKGFNVSRALKMLGMNSTALGFVGGNTGQQLERGLSGLGIPTDFIQVDGETRTNTVIIEAGTGTYLKANEPGPTVASPYQTALVEKVQSLAQSGDTWVLSGSLPPGLPPGFYASLIRILKSQGARVYLDASGEPLSTSAAAAPSLIKPNLDEASQAFGRPITSENDLAAAIDFILGLGVELVALSTGPDGLWLASRTYRVHACPPPITLCNPVGLGDALLAGLVWSFSQGFSLEESARWGVACGTAAAMASGVNFGTLADVTAIFNLVTLDRSLSPQSLIPNH